MYNVKRLMTTLSKKNKLKKRVFTEDDPYEAGVRAARRATKKSSETKKDEDSNN